MQDGKASRTAELVAWARGVGLEAQARDPFARLVLRGPFQHSVRALERDRPWLRKGLRYLSLGLVDHASLRMMALDSVVRAQCAEGMTQMVTLGAGLDLRAYRMPELEGLRTFEVDHPATQQIKRERAATLQPRSTSHTFVSVDFGTESIADKLLAAGYDSKLKTLVLWEAVIMYLPPAAVSATLQELASLTATGTTLALTFMVPRSVPFGAIGRSIIPKVFSAGGEPLLSAYHREDMAALLQEHGFEASAFSDSSVWAHNAGRQLQMGALFKGEEMAVAQRL